MKGLDFITNILRDGNRKDPGAVIQDVVLTAYQTDAGDKRVAETRSTVLVVRGGNIAGEHMHMGDINERAVLTRLNKTLSDNKNNGSVGVNDLRGRTVHAELSRSKRLIHT